MLLTVVLVIVLGLPALVLLMILRDLGEEAIDGVVARVRDNPAVARRAPHFRLLWKTGAVLATLAVMPVAVGIKSANADQWRMLLLVSAGLWASGCVLLGIWWLLASRALADR